MVGKPPGQFVEKAKARDWAGSFINGIVLGFVFQF